MTYDALTSEVGYITDIPWLLGIYRSKTTPSPSGSGWFSTINPCNHGITITSMVQRLVCVYAHTRTSLVPVPGPSMHSCAVRVTVFSTRSIDNTRNIFLFIFFIAKFHPVSNLRCSCSSRSYALLLPLMQAFTSMDHCYHLILFKFIFQGLPKHK